MSIWTLEEYSRTCQATASVQSFDKCSNLRRPIRFCGQVRHGVSLVASIHAQFFVADGHWWPESYYVAAIRARQALSEVVFFFKPKAFSQLN